MKPHPSPSTEPKRRHDWLRKRRSFSRWWALVVALLLAFAGTGQATELGRMRVFTHPARALRTSMRATTRVRFLRATGGVAFSAVAKGRRGEVIDHLQYDPSRPDGERLRVHIEHASGRIEVADASIHDWQLVPLAHFAKSDEDGCVTLFGELQDAALQRTLQPDHYIASYHPALENTLIGLRLLQADLLLLTEEAADLFRDDAPPRGSGEYFLGAGERAPNVAKNRRRHQEVADWLEARQRRGQIFRSYVVGDSGQRVSFYTRRGDLVVRGEPAWLAWRDNEARLAALAAELEAEFLADTQRLSADDLATKYSEAYVRSRDDRPPRLDRGNARIQPPSHPPHRGGGWREPGRLRCAQARCTLHGGTASRTGAGRRRLRRLSRHAP